MTLHKGISIKKASPLNLAEHFIITVAINADLPVNHFLGYLPLATVSNYDMQLSPTSPFSIRGCSGNLCAALRKNPQTASPKVAKTCVIMLIPTSK